MDRRDSRTSQAVVFIIVLVLCMGVIGGYYAWSRNTVRRLDEPVALNCSSLQNVQVVGDRVYYIDGEVLRCLDSDGNVVWPHTLGADVDYRAYETGIIAWRGSQLFILNTDGNMIYTNSVNGTIDSCALGSQYAALEVTETTGTAINVIDLSGNLKDRLDVTGETVLDYGFFNGGAMLWTMALNTDGTVPQTQVGTYQPGKIQTGAITDNDQIIYSVLTQRNDLRLIGTYYADKYTYTGKTDPSSRTLIYGWHMLDAYSDDNKTAVVLAPNTQLESPNTISDLRILYNDTDISYHLPVDCLGVLAGPTAAYAFSPQYLIKCPYTSTYPTAYALTIPVDILLGLTTSNMAAVASNQQTYLLQLP